MATVAKKPTGGSFVLQSKTIFLAIVTFGAGLLLGTHMATIRSGHNQDGPSDEFMQYKKDFQHQQQEGNEKSHQGSFVHLDRSPSRKLPEIPRGPMDATYIDHLYTDCEWTLVYDSSRNYFADYLGSNITDNLLTASTIKKAMEKWMGRAYRFREVLTEQKLNTVDGSLSDVAFLKNIDITNDIKMEQSCQCDKRRRPVLDMAIVVPMHFGKYELTWAFLESLRQLTAFPKEVVFVVGGLEHAKMEDFQTLIHVIAQQYVPEIPRDVKVTVFGTQSAQKPGDGRWFGFNQTTAPIVTLFDNDDYLHPQFFHIWWRIFQKRPELDHALFVYEACTVEGKCSEENLFGTIVKYLKNRQFSEAYVTEKESYPMSKYEELWGMIPTFNKTWWLGNTDAEPNWVSGQQWWDYGCHNGWATFRRHVMEKIPPPVKKYGGEDAIWNYRIGRSKLNYRCVKLEMGCFIKSFCHD